MIRGRVSQNLQVVVEVTLIGDYGQRLSVETVLDTGFQGYLVLTPDVIRELGLQHPEQDTFVLASGEEVDFNTYLATVSWHDRPRLVIVLEAESTPLMGTFLLRGSRVILDMEAGGGATIEELSP